MTEANPLEHLKLERAVIEVMGACNYNSCRMCPQTTPGREKSFLKKMPLDMFEGILDQLTPKYGFPLINLEGSGEPTTNRDLPKYIEACTRRGLKTYIYCNGSHFRGDLMRDSIDAGLTLIRFSLIGYTRELYKFWMGQDNWDLIWENIVEAKKYAALTKSKVRVNGYHLILDPTRVEEEAELYRQNVIHPLGLVSYIWKQHNWSGNFQHDQVRRGRKRTCGRPTRPEITVRAGGIDGKFAAVTPCCQTLGPPNESLSVLGHFSDETFEEIWLGPRYEHLRDAHRSGEFANAPFCENCDFLIEDKEVMVWTNDPKARIGQPMGTSLSFNS